MDRPKDNARHARRISIVLTAIFFGSILSSTLFRIPPDRPLAGTEGKVVATPWTPRSWFDGSFARDAEPWLLRRFGLRGYAIRLANQLDFTFFGHLPESRGTGIIQGKDGWLYENTYRRFYVGQYPVRERQADLLSRQLAALRDALAERGTALVVAISPSKLEIYPEFLPDGIVPDRTKKPARLQIAEALRARQVPLVDAHDLFLSWKGVDGTPGLFPKSGTHWNAYAAQRVLDEICRAAGLAGSVAHVTGHLDRPPLESDSDLLRLLNIPFYRGSDLSPYPVLSEEPPLPAGRRHKALLVGDSFSHQLIDAMGRTGAFSEARLLYYFRGIFDSSWEEDERPETTSTEENRTGTIEDHGAIDWDRLLDGYDLLVLEFNEIFSRDFIWGFADFALQGLGLPPLDASPSTETP